MELICPSCEARYQLPEGSISAKGRQVSCMNCGHSWHAYPPIKLGDPQVGGEARAPSDPKGIRYEPPAGAPRPGERRVQEVHREELGGPSPMVPVAPAADSGGQGGAGHAESARHEQMAEIRQMLAEVQSEERASSASRGGGDKTVVAPAAAAAATGAPRLSPAEEEAQRARQRLQEERAAAERAAREAEMDRDDESDLRRRIDKHNDRKAPKQADVKKIRRKHDRRISRQRHAAKAGSGAFLTGFLLVAIIAASMVSLYVLTPQIIQRVPEAEQPMLQYRATMDRLRVGAAESIANLQEWVVEKLGDNGG